MMNQKKLGLKAIVECATIALPLIAGIILGIAFEDEEMYSSKGIVISTLFVAFLVLCWTGVTVYEFYCAFSSIGGKIKKVISVVFIVLLLITSCCKIYFQYNYTLLGKQATEASRIAEEATEVEDLNAVELSVSALKQWEQVNNRKLFAGLINLLYYSFVFLTPVKQFASKKEPKDCDDVNKADSV